MSSNLSSSFPQFKFGMAKQRSHSIYEFDGFRLEPAKLMLYSGGEELSLPPKAVEVLFVLVREQGQIVSKDDLIDELWSDSVVEESNLSQYLYLLRKTLGTRPDGTAYIETLRRRGYRFTSDVRKQQQKDLHAEGNADLKRRQEHRSVERRGNVLTPTDWNEPESKRPGDTRAVSGEHPVGARRSILAIGTIAIVVVVGLSAAFYFSRSSVSNDESEALEQRVTQLTNGIEVH